MEQTSVKKLIKKSKINELVDLCLQNDEDAFVLLYDCLKPYFIYVYSKFLRDTLVISMEDFLGECRIILYNCVYYYRTDTKTSFLTYVVNAAQNKAKTLLRGASAMKSAFFNTVSLDAYVEEDSCVTYMSLVPSTDADVEKRVLDKIDAEKTIRSLEGDLTGRQMNLFKKMMLGVPKREIESRMNSSPSEIRTIQRKFRKIISVDTDEADC